MAPFKIDFLDHVAIRCMDPERTAAWYEAVLGLTRYHMKVWGSYPIFLLAGKTGLAIFPADSRPSRTLPDRSVRIEHFAFQVDAHNYQIAKEHLHSLNISVEEQDHHYFQSLYFEDPDGHRVELTTLTVSPEDFYR
jgi:catechol 2,3-dioxygenase-like lactoylglutathione lyase family enzyme